MNHETVLAVIFTVLSVILFVAAILGGYDKQKFKTTLESSGYTDVVLQGRAGIFSCGQDDFYRGSFKAKNAQGKDVEGVVCCGLMKNCTVRF